MPLDDWEGFRCCSGLQDEKSVNNGRKFEFENILHLGLVSSLGNLADELSKLIATALVLGLVARWLVALFPCGLGRCAVNTPTTSGGVLLLVARLRWLHFFLCPLWPIF